MLTCMTFCATGAGLRAFRHLARSTRPQLRARTVPISTTSTSQHTLAHHRPPSLTQSLPFFQPLNIMGVLNDVVLVPLLSNFFGVAPEDPTFDRYLKPRSEVETEFEGRSDLKLTVKTRRVFYKNANTSSTTLRGYSKTHIAAPDADDHGASPQIEYIDVEGGGRRHAHTCRAEAWPWASMGLLHSV